MELKRVFPIIAMLWIALIAGCEKDTYKEIVGECPLVVSTIPADKAVNIPLDQIVSATFNVKMNPATINNSSITLTASVSLEGLKAALLNIEGVVTYSDKTATFTPKDPLYPNITYTGKVSSSVKDLNGNALQEDYLWTFSTGASPTVVSTDPANGAISVPVTKIVGATFSVPMDPLTITGTTFTLKQGPNPVTGTVSYTGSTASFTPASSLSANTVYTGTITTGAKNVAGISLAENYVWSFNTGVSPTVISTDPALNAVGVVITKVIGATFSVPMDPLSITTGTTYTLKKGTTPVVGAVSYSGSTALFTPASPLDPNTVYTGTITTGAKSSTGTPMFADYTWSFNTGISPMVILTDPLNIATGVVLNKTVTASFSVPMDYLTITGTTFTLKQGLNPVAGAVTFNGTTASFKSTANLLPGTVYTATITNAAKSLTGIPMAADYVWTFTTGASPTVTPVDPLNLATNVAVNKIVTASFSLPMDPLTLNGTTFTLKQGTTTLLGTVSYNGTLVSFKPSVDLLAGTNYTATITTGAKSTLGIPLAADYSWTFTTASAVAPKVILTNPIDGTTGVVLNKTVSATFDMTMDALTLQGSTFTLKQGTTSVPGAVTYSGTTVNFKPNADLLNGTTYTATITMAAKNLAGISLAKDTVWSFTTRPAAAAPLYSSVFGAFGGDAGITNQGIYSVINNGSIATTGASTLVTGFHDMTGDKYTETPLNIGDVKGRIYTAPPQPVIPATGATGGTAETMAVAQAGLLAASDFYISISPANKPGGIDLGNGELGGRTLAPGVYKSAPGTYNISLEDLTLDAQGDPNAVWIFQCASALTVGIPSGARSVKMINGGLAKNVYWYVGSQAVINYAGGGTMVGTIVANSGVTLSSPGNSTNTTVQTVLNGRAISLVSAVTMVNTIINVPNP